MGNDYSIYGDKLSELEKVVQDMEEHIAKLRKRITEETGMDPVEHCLARIKTDESMREKCRRLGLPETEESALKKIFDAIGIRTSVFTWKLYHKKFIYSPLDLLFQ